MSVLIDGDTKVICQGITGSFGAFDTKGCVDYGTKMVGGVTPGKGGQKDANGLPIFNTVADAVEATGAEASMIFVPSAFAADGILEAAAAGIKVIVAVTEGIPAQDMIEACHRSLTPGERESRHVSDEATLHPVAWPAIRRP